MKELTKDESKILKGIAILFMVGLHLFNRIDTSGYYEPLLYIGKLPLIYYVSLLFDACVPVYCFCSGYALYLKNSTMKENLQRIFNLVKRYWIILIGTILFGIILNNKEIPGSVLDLISNITLIKLTYVGAWWFLQTYVLLTVLSPLIIKAVDRIKVSIIISFIIYFIAYYFRMIHPIQTNVWIDDVVINALVLFGTSQFPFVIGLLFYKYKIISFIRDIFHKNNIIAFIIIMICILLHIIIKSMIIAPFIAVIFICGFSMLKFNNTMKKIFLFFGNHSTNIWLIHMQFYMIFASEIVFCTNTVIGCFIILMILCTIVSFLIDFIYDRLNYDI